MHSVFLSVIRRVEHGGGGAWWEQCRLHPGHFSQEFRPDIGAVWENWVIAEVAKHNLLRGGPSELFFWRSRSQSEVDLVVKTGDDLRAFEIKWRPTRRPATRAFSSLYGVEVGLITSNDPFVACHWPG